MEKVKNIGILTSGGDAPGMNNAIRAIVKAAIKKGIQPYFIYEGFKGMVEGDICKANSLMVSGIANKGGTILGSSRLPEFKEIEVRETAIKQLKKFKIDAVIVIGGDGSFMGALKLTEMGIPCIGIPGTIDNDIVSSDYTIGFDTALNAIVQAIDVVKDTARSHQRCIVIEVMGRFCGDLTIFSSLAAGVEVISTPEKKLKKVDIIEAISKARGEKKRDIIVVVTEKLYDINKLTQLIEKQTKIETRPLILGNLQRGGNPSARDRILATQMGIKAIELLLEGKKGVTIGEINGKLTIVDILNLPKMKKSDRKKEIFNVELTT